LYIIQISILFNNMKIAVSGKGGIGKTTIVGFMARIFRDNGNQVLAIDADPDMNLATILGISEVDKIVPIIEYKKLIAERTGTEVGKSSPIFQMNPKVSDIPDSYCVEHEGIKLMAMGSVRKGGGGCACPENTFLKQLISHLVLLRKEVVLLDMEAGIEHLGRGTAIGVDLLVVVVEPSKASIETANRIKKLSSDIGIKHIKVICNKVRDSADKDFLKENIKDLEISGFLDYSDEIRKINTGNSSALMIEGKPLEQMKQIIDKWRKHG
jgi:CO dehydrogenase maturation factor